MSAFSCELPRVVTDAATPLPWKMDARHSLEEVGGIIKKIYSSCTMYVTHKNNTLGNIKFLVESNLRANHII